ncbi:MAG: hypothetical protein M0Z45_02495 [Actinomycetota bacterium]|nr:hypothetical protein [Actinomycetota bacterium]
MNPLEILRYIADLKDATPDEVASTVAAVVGENIDLPAMRLTALRRMIDAHSSNGALWNVANRLISAMEVEEESRIIRRELSDELHIRHLWSEVAAGSQLLFADGDRSARTFIGDGGRGRFRDKASADRSEKGARPYAVANLRRFEDQVGFALNAGYKPLVVVEVLSFCEGEAIVENRVDQIMMVAIDANVDVAVVVPTGFKVSRGIYDRQLELFGNGDPIHSVRNLKSLLTTGDSQATITYVMGDSRNFERLSVVPELITTW